MLLTAGSCWVMLAFVLAWALLLQAKGLNPLQEAEEAWWERGECALSIGITHSSKPQSLAAMEPDSWGLHYWLQSTWGGSRMRPKCLKFSLEMVDIWSFLIHDSDWEWDAWVQSLNQEDPLEGKLATHSSILAWRILWMVKPGELPSVGLQRVRHNWVTNTHTYIIFWAIFHFLPTFF